MSTETNLRFSVVIPCYNEEAYIADALQSLAAQDFSGQYEVIVVDNACTDQTVTIAKRLGARIVHESRPGVCWARQAGTEAARGEIVVSTDADTVFDPSWLTMIDRRFNAKPQLVAVCGACDFVKAPWWGKVYPVFLFGGVTLATKLFGHPFYITATNTAFRKSAWSGYNTVMTQGGDEVDLLHRLRTKGKVSFDLRHNVHTSSRRLIHGMWYNIFVSFLFYYLAAYYVNKLFRRQIIGLAPVYRQNFISRVRHTRYAPLLAGLTAVMLLGLVISLGRTGHVSAAARHVFHKFHHLHRPSWHDPI